MVRETRSRTRAARIAEAVATGPLGALSHDELGVIFDGLADPLEPELAVALSSACHGLRVPLRAALEVLNEQNERAVFMCDYMGILDCEELRKSKELDMSRGKNELCSVFSADDIETLSMIIVENGLPKLEVLDLTSNRFNDDVIRSFFASLAHGALPSLCSLYLSENKFGPAGAEALGAALQRGAMPKLEVLELKFIEGLGNQGLAALAAPLRKLPKLTYLDVEDCGIGDEGVASLVADLGKDDFKQLMTVCLDGNKITDAGCATLVAAIQAGAMPELGEIDVEDNDASDEALDSVDTALLARPPLQYEPAEDVEEVMEIACVSRFKAITSLRLSMGDVDIAIGALAEAFPIYGANVVDPHGD